MKRKRCSRHDRIRRNPARVMIICVRIYLQVYRYEQHRQLRRLCAAETIPPPNASNPRAGPPPSCSKYWSALLSFFDPKPAHIDKIGMQQEIDRIKAIEDRLFEERQLKIGYGPDGIVKVCSLRRQGREFREPDVSRPAIQVRCLTKHANTGG